MICSTFRPPGYLRGLVGKSTVAEALGAHASAALVAEPAAEQEVSALPILVPLAAFAERERQPNASHSRFLRAICGQQGLPDCRPSSTTPTTRQRLGTAHGLDEMQTLEALGGSQTRLRPLRIGSRASGSSSPPRAASHLPPASIRNLTIAPLGNSEIQQFAQRGHKLRRSGEPHKRAADVRLRVERRAENLVKAVTAHPGVRVWRRIPFC